MSTRAVVFAGQGAQSVGMGKDLATAFPECGALYDRADEALGYKLSAVCFEGPAEELTRSNHCQPAIFVTSVACYKALELKAGPLAFAGAAGLSLGEWTALHVAGALTFEDTLKVLEARGRFMQEAWEEREGGMVSVMGVDIETLQGICERSGVGIANINSSTQIVLSGAREGVEEAEKLAGEAGARRTVMLNVAGAFHSSLMESAATRLEAVLKDVNIQPTAMPVMSNVTGKPHGGPDDIRRNMLRQITQTVRWVDCVQSLKVEGAAGCVECGPGKVLSGLIKRIDGDLSLCNVQDVESLDAAVAALSGA